MSLQSTIPWTPVSTNGAVLPKVSVAVTGLTKRFGEREVLRNIDLEFPAGTVTAVVGPNGSGKTTVMKCILGLVRPDSGNVNVLGRTLNGDWSYRSVVGYMPQLARFPENLTGREVIDLLIDLRGRPASLNQFLMDAFGLEDELTKPVRTLSGGNRQKISAAIAFLFDPEVLILDEPTAGLDPVASGVLKDHIRDHAARGGTVILTSHIMSEVEELAEEIVFLLDGGIAFHGRLDELSAQTGEHRLERAVAKLLTAR